ncbi:MAG: 1-acyl-sn-glycerol-3-phosphate acyltransferase [Spirochaetaceae bacterium]|nr:MAG: 1-acyl-sn-glycerol-3-phosphate acyltransferase [Spirochaetaceae bacterium]
MATMRDRYGELALEMVRNSRQPKRITHDAIFQESNLKNRALINRILDDLVQPGSTVVGADHILELHQRCKAGEPGLLLLEHYSNFDIPCFFYLMHRLGPRYAEAAEAVVAMAAMKLNEESKFVLAFTEAYTRIVIYPGRALEQAVDGPQGDEEARKAKLINMSAMREMVRCKNNGRIVLLFPTGTRYRPGVPDSKRILRAVDTYIKGFRNAVFVGIAGNVLLVNPQAEMAEDYINPDTVTFAAGPVIPCSEFRNAARNGAPPELSTKDAVAEAVGRQLDEMHQVAESARAASSGSRPTG